MLSATNVRRLVAAAGIAGLGAAIPVVGAGTAGAAPQSVPQIAPMNAPVVDDTPVAPAPVAPAAPAATGTYTVVKGDTLSAIALAKDVDGGWPALYAANRDQLTSGPDWIDIGQVLKLAGVAQAPAAAPAPAPKSQPAPPAETKSRTWDDRSSRSETRETLTVTAKPSTPKPVSKPAASSVDAPAVSVSGKAAAAVAFARAQLGKPYVYGAEGPNAYDCSGLVQAAWKAAGVSLPRVTNDQYAAGHKVSISNLQPGDLVFYYSGISHVGIYIGNGQIIHAPNSRTVVKIASVDSMPIAGATRPA
ncbi:NlpC/P60 family protein [Yinghuangia seranimata]|uniref:NlpC/P60 family protein n=1 Tax=Yinghuangia seranimata TaxID=408067 RepID=UPI00248D0405|nr:LysM peptidoglycan-binding domain-containing C40 family peptidase [Yinghuangia seranimata]MDI2126559.1 LysM peptidoglycan-binding domain-containing C40 family peptidase [Yinghuangia seranimata]